MRAKLRAVLLELTKEQKRMATRRTSESARSTQPPTTELPDDKRPARKGAMKPGAPAVTAAPAAAAPVEISPDARRGMIAEAAYLRAEQRGFVPGYELEDWIAAESEVDALLEAEHTRRPQ
jgi:hypothetical protein